jgi:hypothetical protein
LNLSVAYKTKFSYLDLKFQTLSSLISVSLVEIYSIYKAFSKRVQNGWAAAEYGRFSCQAWYQGGRGVILGDSIGNFLVAFAAHIHHSSVLEAEL